MNSRSNKAKALITTSILSAAAGLSLAGCTSPEVAPAEEEVYCVNEDNEVVDENLCDGEGSYMNQHGGMSSYFFFVGNLGGNSYSPGQRIPSSYVSKGQRVSPVDSAARARAGLPKSGPVSSGTRVQGGIGKGGIGTGKPGSVGG